MLFTSSGWVVWCGAQSVRCATPRHATLRVARADEGERWNGCQFASRSSPSFSLPVMCYRPGKWSETPDQRQSGMALPGAAPTRAPCGLPAPRHTGPQDVAAVTSCLQPGRGGSQLGSLWGGAGRRIRREWPSISAVLLAATKHAGGEISVVCYLLLLLGQHRRRKKRPT